ncbi:hypothetical protein SLEP1_g56812 [Rubroshorea leprosula]|uniref:Uncharacterized protein n=1 Tax=Rubroshorea leprosula TaxID=152421 RepID=A0AAV5MMU7_9ROSI|nr:hypothetical protein SLEP1_g56812 [Rubroshorea leprosula]
MEVLGSIKIADSDGNNGEGFGLAIVRVEEKVSGGDGGDGRGGGAFSVQKLRGAEE